MSLLASKCPEYRVLRAKSERLALVWQLGHGSLWICLLSLPGALAAWWVSRGDPELHHEAWGVVVPVLLFAVIGVFVKRYAVNRDV